MLSGGAGGNGVGGGGGGSGNDETKSGSWDKYDSLVGEDDVFMTLDLPRENSESRCGSEGSGGSQSECIVDN